MFLRHNPTPFSCDGVNILIEDYAGDPSSDDRIIVIISTAAEQLPDDISCAACFD
ncbi:hypothetical protein A2U01_0102910 [Trifolium medium]|uniref:Uncharacterized protein n=1 Tax=Trifolium medium TaxID=97028 RepID=A0A392V048_9FABA|nr:hypothetical protein [Trifolium medium]